MTVLTHDERSKIISYLVELSKEKEKLEKEADELLPHIDFSEKAYSSYKLKMGAISDVRQQMKDCHDQLLRSL